MNTIINGPNRGRYERVDLSRELSGALSLVREALDEGDVPSALAFISDALRLERVLQGEISSLWCADCSAAVVGEEPCECGACVNCEASPCVCRFYAEPVPVRDAERLNLARVLAELRRLAALVV